MSKKRKRKSKKKTSMTPLFLIILVIGGVFGYLYFFNTPAVSDTPDTTESITVHVKPGQGQEENMELYNEREKERRRKLAEELAKKEKEKEEEDTSDEKEEVSLSTGHVEVHFIDVGQGDSILIKYIDDDTSDGDDSENMLIDAGDTNKGTLVRNYLKSEDVSELKYFVCTHPDADHIGGAASVVSNIPITSEIVWGPYCEKDTKTYENLQNEIDFKSYKYTMPNLCEPYSLGEAMLVFYGPTEEYEDANNNSLVCKLTYKGDSVLFTGDCSEEEENDLLDNYSPTALRSDVLKVSHHGSQSASRQPFLDAVSPVYAVISVGADNSYGHPNKSVMERLEDMGVNIYRTDESGNIVAVMKGDRVYEWKFQ